MVSLDIWQRRNLVSVSQTLPLPEDVLTPQRHVLYFFAPWCQVCQWSVPTLNDLHEKSLIDESFRLWVIALDYDDRAAVERFVADTGLKATITYGDPELARTYQIGAFPTMYLLDQDRRVVSHRVGYTPAWLIHLKIYWQEIFA